MARCGVRENASQLFSEATAGLVVVGLVEVTVGLVVVGLAEGGVIVVEVVAVCLSRHPRSSAISFPLKLRCEHGWTHIISNVRTCMYVCMYVCMLLYDFAQEGDPTLMTYLILGSLFHQTWVPKRDRHIEREKERGLPLGLA